MNMTTSDTCPWCHQPSNFRERLCRRCGHCARIPPIYCDCIACLAGRPTYKPVLFTTTLYDLADGMAALVERGLARRAPMPARVPDA